MASIHNRTIKTTEMHTGGEPLRIIEAGYPELLGETILDKREYFRKNSDAFRKMVMFEPRGHFDMFGAFLVEPDDKDAVVGVIFLGSNGYVAVCGHGIIALGRYLIDRGFVKTPTSPETEVKIQCPVGTITAVVEYRNGKTGYVKFRNVPAYVTARETVDVDGLGQISLDLCYAGNLFAIVSSSALGYSMLETEIATLIKHVGDILETCHGIHDVPDLASVVAVIMTEEKDDRTITLNVFGDRQMDRSPCGSGTTAVMALQHYMGKIRPHQPRVFQSVVTKSEFIGTVVEERTENKSRTSVIVEVQGNGYYTGTCSFTIEENDLLGEGFLVR